MGRQRHDRRGRLGYYAAVSQIIAILLLVLVLEYRLLGPRLASMLRTIINSVIVGFVVAGEFISLYVLKEDEGSMSFPLTIAAVLVLFALIVFLIVLPTFQQRWRG